MCQNQNIAMAFVHFASNKMFYRQFERCINAARIFHTFCCMAVVNSHCRQGVGAVNVSVTINIHIRISWT